MNFSRIPSNSQGTLDMPLDRFLEDSIALQENPLERKASVAVFSKISATVVTSPLTSVFAVLFACPFS